MESSRTSRREDMIAFFLPIILLLPWIAKPFHVDDHIFVWVAQQIARSPLDFFGFAIDYGYAEAPIYTVNHNPPLVSFYLAPVGALSGWSEWALHAAMLPVTGLAGLGVLAFAREFSCKPSLVAMAVVLTPAFLVSASSLMTDVPLLAAYVWAVVAWRRGMLGGERKWLIIAAMAMVVAPLVKYFGITLVPLLAVYAVTVRDRPRGWWVYFVPALAVFGLFQAYLYARYGITGIVDAAGVATGDHWREGETTATRPLVMLVFLGASALPMAVLAVRSAGTVVSALLAVFSMIMCVPMFEGYALVQLMTGGGDPFALSTLVHFGVFLTAGLVLLTAAARQLAHMEDRRDAVLMGVWIVGTLVFAVVVNHYVSVRTLLPMIPALAIVALARTTWNRFEGALLVPAALLSLWVVWGDAQPGWNDKDVAERALAVSRESDSTLHYVAFWGLEYYLFEGGGVPLRFEEAESFGAPVQPIMEPGDLLLVDAYVEDVWRPIPRGFQLVDADIVYSNPSRATTFDVHANAGFHAHKIGLLPYVLGPSTEERFLLLRWDGEGG